MTKPTPVESIGRALGKLLAPAFTGLARLRGGRSLHPAGTLCAAEVVAVAEDPALVELAKRLSGEAIVRMSGALWRRPGKPEMLGCAVRLRGDRGLEITPDDADQDLLFATARAPWSVLLATFVTDAGDYLHNVYYTLGWLDTEEVGRVELRLVPVPPGLRALGSRRERLVAAMEAGLAHLRLELRRPGGRWQPLCDLRLRGKLMLDARAMAYSPDRNGQGLRPRGLLHALRGPTYAAGQVPRGAVDEASAQREDLGASTP